MPAEHPRILRERKTITAMIEIYCRENHNSQEILCPECQALSAYVDQRLAKCPYQENKPTCANCPIHCYQPAFRQQIRTVMRYAGPRMLLRHPLLTVRHLLDNRRKPVLPSKRR